MTNGGRGGMLNTAHSSFIFPLATPRARIARRTRRTGIRVRGQPELLKYIMPDSIELKPVGRSAPKPPPRHPDTAPGGLGQAYRATEEKVKMASHLQEGGLDAVSTWGLGAAAW